MFSKTFHFRQALVALLCGAWLLAAAQPVPDGKWLASTLPNGTRLLSYTSPAALLGKPSTVNVGFFCSPVSTKTERGMLGIELTIQGVAALKRFQFDAFEGPDAITHGRKLMRLAVKRPGKPDWVVDLSPNGWTPDTDRFTFGIAQESRRARSTEKALLQALAEDADALHLTVTDAVDRTLQVNVTVPVSGRHSDFKALLAGLP